MAKIAKGFEFQSGFKVIDVFHTGDKEYLSIKLDTVKDLRNIGELMIELANQRFKGLNIRRCAIDVYRVNE